MNECSKWTNVRRTRKPQASTKYFTTKEGVDNRRKGALATPACWKKKKKNDFLSPWKPKSTTKMRMLILALRVSPVAPGHDDLNSSRYQSTIVCQNVLSGEEEGKAGKCCCF